MSQDRAEYHRRRTDDEGADYSEHGMFSLWYNFAMLSVEAQQVIWLRLLKLGKGGPHAALELQSMLLEKTVAASDAMGRLAMGGSPKSVVRGYRKKVRATRRRLTKRR